jgi:hypothetical protein
MSVETGTAAAIGGPLPTRAPFHLEATVRVLQRRPTNLVDVWDDGWYQRVLAAGDSLVVVEVTNRGTIDAPDVRFRLRSGDTAASASVGAYLRRILGLDADPDGLQRLAHRRELRATVIALRGMRPPRFATLFETFVHVIPFQQLRRSALLHFPFTASDSRGAAWSTACLWPELGESSHAAQCRAHGRGRNARGGASGSYVDPRDSQESD